MLFVVVVVLATLDPASANASGEAAVQVTANVPYGTDGEAELLLDIYEPPVSSAPAPVLIVIHGGGWVAGDKEQFAPFSRSLATAGFLVFDINYSLDLGASPAYPREVNDVRTALAWVRAHAGDHHGDPSRIGLVGGSAGGYLAAMLGTQADTPGAAPVRAVVSLSGPMDIAALVANARQAATSTPEQCGPGGCLATRLASTALRGLLGCDPLQCSDQLLREASPITYVSSASPAFFMANSTTEIVPASQATGMATALRSRGVPVEVELVPGDRHSIAYVSDIRGALGTFLTKHLVQTSGAARSTAPDPSGETSHQSHGMRRLIRWLVVAAAVVCLLAAVAITRRRASRKTGRRRTR